MQALEIPSKWNNYGSKFVIECTLAWEKASLITVECSYLKGKVDAVLGTVLDWFTMQIELELLFSSKNNTL